MKKLCTDLKKLSLVLDDQMQNYVISVAHIKEDGVAQFYQFIAPCPRDTEPFGALPHCSRVHHVVAFFWGFLFVLYLQSVIFHSTRKSKSIAREITRVEHPEVQPGDSETWTRETVSVPSLPPSDLVGCRIIDVNYYVEVRLYIMYSVEEHFLHVKALHAL